jgi:hypothetical protein
MSDSSNIVCGGEGIKKRGALSTPPISMWHATSSSLGSVVQQGQQVVASYSVCGGGISAWQAKLNQTKFLHRLGQMGSVLSIVQLTPPDVSHDVASCVRRGLVAPHAVGFAKFYLGLEYVGHGALRKNTFAQTVLSVVHMQSGSLWSAT